MGTSQGAGTTIILFPLDGPCICPKAPTHFPKTLKLWTLLNRKEMYSQVETKHRHLPPAPRNFDTTTCSMIHLRYATPALNSTLPKALLCRSRRSLYVLTDYEPLRNINTVAVTYLKQAFYMISCDE